MEDKLQSQFGLSDINSIYQKDAKPFYQNTVKQNPVLFIAVAIVIVVLLMAVCIRKLYRDY